MTALRWTRTHLVLRFAITAKLAEAQHRLLPPSRIEDMEGGRHLHCHLRDSLGSSQLTESTAAAQKMLDSASVHSCEGALGCAPGVTWVIGGTDMAAGETRALSNIRRGSPCCTGARHRQGQLEHLGMSSKYHLPGTDRSMRQAAGTAQHVMS